MVQYRFSNIIFLLIKNIILFKIEEQYFVLIQIYYFTFKIQKSVVVYDMFFVVKDYCKKILKFNYIFMIIQIYGRI